MAKDKEGRNYFSSQFGQTRLSRYTQLEVPGGPPVRVLHDGRLSKEQKETIRANVGKARENVNTAIENLSRGLKNLDPETRQIMAEANNVHPSQLTEAHVQKVNNDLKKTADALYTQKFEIKLQEHVYAGDTGHYRGVQRAPHRELPGRVKANLYDSQGYKPKLNMKMGTSYATSERYGAQGIAGLASLAGAKLNGRQGSHFAQMCERLNTAYIKDRQREQRDVGTRSANQSRGTAAATRASANPQAIHNDELYLNLAQPVRIAKNVRFAEPQQRAGETRTPVRNGAAVGATLQGPPPDLPHPDAAQFQQRNVATQTSTPDRNAAAVGATLQGPPNLPHADYAATRPRSSETPLTSRSHFGTDSAIRSTGSVSSLSSISSIGAASLKSERPAARQSQSATIEHTASGPVAQDRAPSPSAMDIHTDNCMKVAVAAKNLEAEAQKLGLPEHEMRPLRAEIAEIQASTKVIDAGVNESLHTEKTPSAIAKERYQESHSSLTDAANNADMNVSMSNLPAEKTASLEAKQADLAKAINAMDNHVKETFAQREGASREASTIQQNRAAAYETLSRSASDGGNTRSQKPNDREFQQLKNELQRYPPAQQMQEMGKRLGGIEKSGQSAANSAGLKPRQRSRSSIGR